MNVTLVPIDRRIRTLIGTKPVDKSVPRNVFGASDSAFHRGRAGLRCFC